MAEIVGEGKIVLVAETAALIAQIERLKLPPVKVRLQIDKRDQIISPDLKLSAKSKKGLQSEINRAIAQASRSAGTFTLTNTKFVTGAKTKQFLKANIAKMIREVSTELATTQAINLKASVDKTELDASAEAAAIGARERMQTIFLKPLNVFINADINGALGAFNRFDVESRKIFKGIGLAWAATTAGIVAGTAAIGISAVKQFSEVEKSATNAASLIGGEALTDGGATVKQAQAIFAKAKDQFIKGAQEIATTTVFSTKEAADGYYFLASAGESAKDSIALLPQIAKFAQAGQLDLETSTESLLQSFNALGLNFGDFTTKQKNIVLLTDTLTKANIKSITDLQGLSDALKNRAAASFTLYGQSIQTTIATIGQFSTVGVTGLKAGEQAAIALRDVFQKGNSKDFRDAFKENGIHVLDAKGKFNDFSIVIAELAKRYNELNDAGKSQFFKTLGITDRSSSGLRFLIDAENKGSLKKVADSLKNVQGITSEVSGLQQSSFSAVLQNFEDTIGKLFIEAGKAPTDKLRKFFLSFNAGNALSDKATKAFAGLGKELGNIVDTITGFISGGGLTSLIKGLHDLAVGTFQGLKGFGEEFSKAFSGDNKTGAEGFAGLLTRLGALSARVFPEVGAALGKLSKFFIDNESQILSLTKAWLELTAAIFAIRVVIIPLQKVASLAEGLIATLGGEGLSGALLEAAAAAPEIAGPIGIAIAAIILAIKESKNLRHELASDFKLPFKIFGDVFKLGKAIAGLIPGGGGGAIATAFRVLGNIMASTIHAALAGFRLLDSAIIVATDLINGDLTGAWGHAKDGAIDFGNAITFGVFPAIHNAISSATLDLRGFNAALDNVRNIGNQLKNTVPQGPLVGKFGPVQGPGLGGRDAGAAAASATAQKRLNLALGGLDAEATKQQEKEQRKREAAMRQAATAAEQARKKIQAAIKATNDALTKNAATRKNVIKDYLDAVKRAADQAKQAISDFGDQIGTSLVASLDPLRAQANINDSLDSLFKTLHENVGVLAGSDTEKARANLDALSSALSSIGDETKKVAEAQGAVAAKGFVSTEVQTLLERAQAAFTSGQISADQLKQLQDQANTSLAAAGAVKIPVAFTAVDEDGKPVTDPRKNGIVSKLDMLRTELLARAAGLKQASKPGGIGLVVGFTDGVKEQWTTQAQPYLASLGRQIPNGLGGQIVLRKRMTPHGEAIMLGLQDGMNTVWQRDVTTFIQRVAPWIAKNKGPIAADAALLVPHGSAIMGGLLEGLKSGWAVVMNFIKGVATSVKDSAKNIGASFGGAFSGVMGGDGGGGAFQGKFADLINAAAKKNKIDPLLLASIIKQESGFNPNAVSPVGAQGLGQLMPATARGLGVKDAFDPAQNIGGAAKYIAQLLKEFGGNTKLAVAAYNAGPNAVSRAHGVPHFSETQGYVQNVLANLAAYQKQSGQTDTKTAGFPFPLLKTALLAATMNLDGANRLQMGAIGATAQESGLHVSAGKIHHSKYTTTGNLSDHGIGLALDVAGTKKAMINYAELARTIFKPAQLIHSPLGESFNGGPWQPIGDAGLRADHFDHVHVGRPHLVKAIEDILVGKIKGRRAYGGYHESGTYMVGENGPELRSFGSSGDIITNANMRQMLNQSNNQGNAAPSVGQLHVHTNAQNPEVIAAVVESHLRGRLISI